jgi:translation elongation factor P/translation initiation factor 5A
MQRRAVAVFVALFLAIAGVAGALTATADSPEIALENPDFDVSQGDLIEVNGESYTVADISESEEGGGHGGAATTVISGTLEREFTSEVSETWANGSTVTVDERDWQVTVDGANATEFTLVEVLDRQAILEADDAAENQTVTLEDGEYVAVTDDSGERTLVPAEEYFPAPEERSYAVGDTLQYDGQTATVDGVTADGAVLVWEATQTETIEVGQEGTVTLGGTDYVAHFPDASTLRLSSDMEAYEAQVAEIDTFNQYNSGLSRVFILSMLSSIMLAGAAFLPSRY